MAGEALGHFRKRDDPEGASVGEKAAEEALSLVHALRVVRPAAARRLRSNGERARPLSRRPASDATPRAGREAPGRGKHTADAPPTAR